MRASAALHEMAKAGIALPSALWVSQAIDWEMEKVPKAERQSMLRLMQVFSEHSASPELPDEAVLRRAFKSLAASQIQSMQENAQLRQYIEDLEATVAAERHQSEGQALQARGELTTAKLKEKKKIEVFYSVDCGYCWNFLEHSVSRLLEAELPGVSLSVHTSASEPLAKDTITYQQLASD